MAKDVAMIKALDNKLNSLLSDLDLVKDKMGITQDSTPDADADNMQAKKDDDSDQPGKESDLAPQVKDKPGMAMPAANDQGMALDAAPKMPLNSKDAGPASEEDMSHLGPLKRAAAKIKY